MSFVQMIEHGGHHAARAAGRCRDDIATRSVLFAHGQRIGVDHPPALKGRLIATCLDIIGGSLAGQPQRSRQHAFVVDTAFHRGFHDFPHFMQIFPYLRFLTHVDIFPVRTPVLIAPAHDVFDGCERIDMPVREDARVFGALRKCSSAYAVDRPLPQRLMVFTIGEELHAIGMKGQEHLRLPFDVHFACGVERVDNRHVCHVALSRSGQAAIKYHLERLGCRIPVQEQLGGLLRPHRVTARWPDTYSI